MTMHDASMYIELLFEYQSETLCAIKFAGYCKDNSKWMHYDGDLEYSTSKTAENQKKKYRISSHLIKLTEPKNLSLCVCLSE